MARRRCSGLLFLSSSEIYGDPDPRAIPTPEDYRGLVSCTGPRACYDEAKRFGETLCTVFARQYGVATRIARPFNNYGPGLKINDGRVLPDFARDVLAGRDIVMLSDGSATRTFCYSADAVTGYYKVLVRGRDGEPYNIGTETPEISVKELAARVVEASSRLFGYRGKVVSQPSQDSDYLVDNPNRRCPIIAKARSELGYEPKVAFAEGLDRTLIWYRDHQVATVEPWASTTPVRTGGGGLMNVSVIGTGYVGLVTGACLVREGPPRNVCVDTESSQGRGHHPRRRAPFHEPGLDPLLGAARRQAACSATTDLRAAVLDSDLTLLATGTPFDGQTSSTSPMSGEATRQIGEALRDKQGYHVVAVKSTVVPGTTDSAWCGRSWRRPRGSDGRDRTSASA